MMKKQVFKISVILMLLLTGCKSGQEATLLENPEKRIYKTFDEKKEEYYVGDSDNLDTEAFRKFYFNHVGYVIPESELRKFIEIQHNDETIIAFKPVVDSIILNSSYVLIIKDHYIKAVSSNPSKYSVPEYFELEKIINLDEQKKLNNKVLQQMSKKGKAKIMDTDLYFDTQRIGKLIYTIKVDVETSEYSYGEVFIYDGFSGEIID